MSLLLKKGDRGEQVGEVQTLLVEKGFLTDEEVNSTFDQETYRAVRAFQSQNLDENGQPLVVDGKVGELTWWSLHNPKPSLTPPSAIDFTEMPPGHVHASRSGCSARINCESPEAQGSPDPTASSSPCRTAIAWCRKLSTRSSCESQLLSR
jgi:Putative peptidoglycan binding domain